MLMSSAPEALVHDFFDELRQEGAKLPNGKEMPALFNFTKEGTSDNDEAGCLADWQNCRLDQISFVNWSLHTPSLRFERRGSISTTLFLFPSSNYVSVST